MLLLLLLLLQGGGPLMCTLWGLLIMLPWRQWRQLAFLLSLLLLGRCEAVPLAAAPHR